ncbi:MAG: hypothetical protein AVDCRST_MAG73-1334 [uncultured Thermomicrobiales bacterium]|uniref:N-acetyltransferase domain-containing protein n=1 Tax=uncultured Thermomicrobiales bacterium TaxID=1645740 RepID=A0A6J4U0W9_9BACT|nr:MAG: hypothetical protein AVDCRST_MAG73-1334 [uncultured Thermomicrobiales bacterium]
MRPWERDLFLRLSELYLYDFSEFEGWSVQESGLYSRNRWSELLLETPGRDALLLRVRGEPAGFAVVDPRSPLPGGDRHRYVAEFLVLRKFRRGGYGEAMARALFDRYPGHWHILQVPKNAAAQRFWRRVIGAYTGDRFTEHVAEDGDLVQTFDTADKVIR